MTHDEMIEVIQAHKDGKTIEYYDIDKKRWVASINPNWDFWRAKYRVKPLEPDSIDWSHVHPNWKYMARDDNGVVCLYTAKPSSKSDTNWRSGGSIFPRVLEAFSSYRQGTVPWNESLVERPEGV